MKLYGSNASPFVRKVRILLHEKNLDYDFDVIDGRLRTIDEIKPLSPLLQVPVLEDDGLTLFDSNVIQQYLFKTYSHVSNNPIPLCPSLVREDHHHWNDKLILSAIDTATDSMVNVFINKLMQNQANHAPTSYLERQTTRAQFILEWLDKQLDNIVFWPGYFSILDINLICALEWFQLRELLDISDYPNLYQLIQFYNSRDSIVNTRA